MLPWYTLQAGGLTGEVESGTEALGGLALVVLALAIVTGWSSSARVHPLLPVVAACALAVIVVAKIADPPSATDAITHGSNASGAGASLVEAFAKGIANTVGLHYAPAWGIWLAAAGAAAALAGTLARARG